jgi:hypothetical protein
LESASPRGFISEHNQAVAWNAGGRSVPGEGDCFRKWEETAWPTVKSRFRFLSGREGGGLGEAANERGTQEKDLTGEAWINEVKPSENTEGKTTGDKIASALPSAVGYAFR